MMTERERLLAFLFDREDKRVLNIKFFRGRSENLTLEEMCAAARAVADDTWKNEGRLVDVPPVSRQGDHLTA